MILYVPIETTGFHPDLGSYITYGIRVLTLQKEDFHEIKRISDISTDKKLVSQICWLCTKHGLSPVQLMDVLEDFL